MSPNPQSSITQLVDKAVKARLVRNFDRLKRSSGAMGLLFLALEISFLWRPFSIEMDINDACLLCSRADITHRSCFVSFKHYLHDSFLQKKIISFILRFLKLLDRKNQCSNTSHQRSASQAAKTNLAEGSF
jgi:hypothetical protein